MTIRSEPRLAVVVVAFLGALAIERPARADEPSPNASETDPLEAKRERFRAGTEKYRAGAYEEALAIWNAIYAELGPEQGYRLAFNIARAYQQLAASRAGADTALADTTKALEHYAAYVTETTRRREAGEPLEPLIERQEQEAKTHLGRLVLVGDPRTVVKIDDEREPRHAGSAVWVAPGRHLVTFEPGASGEHVVGINAVAGRVSEVSMPAATGAPPPPSLRFETRNVHPFSQSVLYVAAGVSALTIVVPMILRSNALSIKDDYDRAVDTTSRARLDSDYASASSAYYASWAIPSIAFATTLGLTAYWFWKTKETRVPVQAMARPGGGALGASARF